MPHQDGQRLLIFVIAYCAESTLKSVLERIPSAIFEQFDCEVLVVDDGSEDRGFEIGHEYKNSHPEIQMTVLRNELNQGYGGNQKVGYQYAITEGFDYVAMVHGDGQYAPEELPRLMEPLASGRAEAVFGSRMIEQLAALKGGMPLYKYAGNKILTALQNRLLGTALSEFHSGYRIFSVEALKTLPFRLNTNDFHFDTEIIIQLLNSGARIVELPIPTFYGDEICRVNGMKYAFDVLAATLLNTAHRSGVLYQRRFDTDSPKAVSDLKLGYDSSHTFAIDAVPSGATALDLGGGRQSGVDELQDKGCKAERANPSAIGRETGGSPKQPLQDVSAHEYLLLLDAIEHLANPEAFIEELRSQFEHDPKQLVLSTPNIAFIINRLMLLIGQFNYSKSGVLDLTHRRLFTFRSARRLLLDAGFRIDRVRGVPAPFPKAFGDGPFARACLAANNALIKLSKTLFSYQIFIEATTTPDVHFVLRNTKEASARRLQRSEVSSNSLGMDAE